MSYSITAKTKQWPITLYHGSMVDSSLVCIFSLLTKPPLAQLTLISVTSEIPFYVRSANFFLLVVDETVCPGTKSSIAISNPALEMATQM